MKRILLVCGIFYSSIVLCSDNTLSEDMQTRKPNNISHPTGKVVGGIALFVNGEPITLHAIENLQTSLHTDKLRATDMLVMEKLRESEIKRLKIEVTEAQLDSQIAQIAQQNNMSLEQFYTAVMKEGMSLVEYRAKLKEQFLMQELMRKILFSSNVGQEDELRKYYNEHPNEFLIPKEIASTKFVSKDKKVLESYIASDQMDNIPENVAHSDEVFVISEMPPHIADVFLITDEGKFTQILESGDGQYVAFYVQEKRMSEQVEFEKAKNYIAQKLIANNQDKILNDYFEKVRSRSKIVFIR